VAAGDFDLKGGYGYKLKLAPHIQGKAGLDLSYTSFTWQPTAHAQTSFSADPKISVSVSPRRGQEVSLTAAATAYSTQGGEKDFRSYASRRVFLGAYWGFYF
jgi:hypothetical protein